MNDDELGAALRTALAPPEVTPGRYAGQRLRGRVADRREARRRALTAGSTAVVVLALLGGLVGIVRGGTGGSDDAGGGGGAPVSAPESAAGRGGAGSSASPGTPDSAAAPRTLLTPVELVEVRSRREGPCPSPRPAGSAQLDLGGGSVACLTLGPVVLTVRETTRLALVPNATAPTLPPSVAVQPVPRDAAVLLAWTRANVGEALAFRVDGEIVSAPEVVGPIDGLFEVPTPDAATAERVYRRLGGT